MTIRHLVATESTQEEMKRWLETGPVSHLDAILADVQTSGRGRHGRDWIATAGNLSASIFLRDISIPLTWIPLWIGVSLVKAIGKEGLRLKWPNDLVTASGAKLGGILCEKVETGVVAGVGLNLKTAPGIEGRRCASLQDLHDFGGFSGELPTAHDLLETLIGELSRTASVSTLREEFAQVSLFPEGHSVFWKDSRSGAQCEGRISGLGIHGELCVRLQDGKLQQLFSEEIVGLREKIASTPDQE